MLRKDISSGQAKDSGLAIVLILLLIAAFRIGQPIIFVAIGVLVLTMAWPDCFKPFAVLWFRLSEFLGSIVSKILLTVVFYGVATPVGLIRQLTGADPMGMGKWKKDDKSVFFTRNQKYTLKDINKPY